MIIVIAIVIEYTFLMIMDDYQQTMVISIVVAVAVVIL